MTVAFLLTGPFPHVSETFILNQITGLIDRGHDVHVYAQRPDADAVAHRAVETYRLLDRTHYWLPMPANPLRRVAGAIPLLAGAHGARAALWRALDAGRHGRMASSLTLLYWSARLAPRQSYDIVYCHFGWNGLYASMLRHVGVLEGRLVTAFHGADLSWQLGVAGADVYAPLFATGDLFLPVSEHWRRKLLALGCPAGKVEVHRMGIDAGHFAYLERRPAPDEPVRLVTICRLVEKKGVEYGIRAAARLTAEGRRVRYAIVGDGPLRDDLERLARELQLGETVTFLGAQEHDAVLAALQNSHIALAPSVTGRDGDQEGIPVSLMEAMATGMPVVSTTHSGIPELVQDGVSGLLVPERDDTALAAALARLIDRPAAWPDMGRAGRRQVLEHFDIATLNDRLVERFRGVLQDRPS